MIRSREGIPAIVLGIGPTGLGVVRSLGRGGVRVLALDFRNHSAAGSRYCTFALCSDPVSETENVIAEINAHVDKLGGTAVVFPTSDVFVFAIARFRDNLHKGLIVRLPPPELFEKLISKKGTAEIAERAGVPYPKTLFMGSAAEAESHGDELTYPAFIKPCYGHLWRRAFNNPSKGILVNGKSELVEKMSIVEQHDLEVVVQEVVPGPDSNIQSWVGYFDKDSKVVAEFEFRKWRQHPPHFGVGSLVESALDDELRTLGLRLLEGSGYIGPAGVEFKRHQGDGGLRLMEVSVRYDLQLDLAVKAGVDLPMINYLEAAGLSFDEVHDWKNGVKWLDFTPDLISSMRYLRNGELRFLEWLASFRNVRSHAFFDPGDLRPFLREYSRLLLLAGQRTIRRIWPASK